MKQVLVTGGAHRLGAEIVRQFAAAGWRVWCHYQSSATAAQALQAELGAQGACVELVQADLAEHAEVERMVARIAQSHGPLDCLVNNASLFEPDTGAAMDLTGTRQQLEVNLIAPLALASLMARQNAPEATPGQRSVIHILDQKVFNLNPDYFSYTVSKLALERSVALQAQALAPLRVCGVAPGLMFLSGPQTQDNFDRASRVNLMRQPIDPAQVAATCLFLAQNPCITGTTVCVDNGQHLVPLERDVMFLADTPHPKDAS
ncbi:SDR family oxidoreductase [uncultured Limnohabitans sp.]|jgi:NAD(P)-dependent dehydrogenase (short-subunit alcohol dehydrogenase family)|uniref:SDR family oxidoreductase n=1 Tax=uncultured Limnohabitans sp. TaxID=768543 RepID=UPI001B59A77E|nr:SDR family oxidoreductase [uncultured Limnohabitans sp.]MBP6221519.1 SDR family oxidoreductase [Limnohabitans sp.]MBP6246177.1 SDR family oxidoreductase [Limnohabitans sp.]